LPADHESSFVLFVFLFQLFHVFHYIVVDFGGIVIERLRFVLQDLQCGLLCLDRVLAEMLERAVLRLLVGGFVKLKISAEKLASRYGLRTKFMIPTLIAF